MITPNVTGMSQRKLHAYEGLQYYIKMPDKIKKYSKKVQVESSNDV